MVNKAIIKNMFVCPNAADPKKQARPKYLSCQKYSNFFLYFWSVGNFPIPYGNFFFLILYHTDVWIVDL